MADFIEVETVVKLISGIRKRLDKTNPHFLTVDNALTNIIQLVEMIPARRIQKGEWIGFPDCLVYTNALAHEDIACSACGEVFNILDNDTERFNFCPHCGADMRGSQDE